MDALILSCSTGGGHNAAARAIREAWEAQGGKATLLDPYTLLGNNWDKRVGDGYIRLAQNTPRLFGAIYRLGDAYRRLPIHSPVYAVNKVMLGKMKEYLDAHSFDVILYTHVYPGEILAYMRHRGLLLPPCFFVATDYVCIPFTEETNSDFYVTPHKELAADFIRRGIPAERLLPFGIPVAAAFRTAFTREEAIKALGLEADKRYLLLSGGSIGAGAIDGAIRALEDYLYARPRFRVIVICGNNKKLYEKATEKYAGHPQLIFLEKTDRMALYMRACDAYLSKPGGLSSTEAAVSGTPLIHLSPIPGCETLNMDFFSHRGMSIAVGDDLAGIPAALAELENQAFLAGMREKQRENCNPFAAEEICRFAAEYVEKTSIKEKKEGDVSHEEAGS